MREADQQGADADVSDTPLNGLAAELRERGVELHELDPAPGARQVPLLKITAGGRELQMWESAWGAGFLIGLGELAGPASEPSETADRLVERLRAGGSRS